MANFFAELKRRHIYRVGAAYVVVAWALTQLVEILAQVFTLPLWIAQTAIVLLAIGFPVALFVAWTIESKPHQALASAVRSKPTLVDWTLCGAVAVLIALSGYRLIAPSSDATTRQASVDAARKASASQASAISLAVLPFANLSGDASQEFFSDGMTEEIITALARIPDLRVVARGSASQFKGERRDLRAVGQALGATHLIEGSVRRAGTQLRVTAQLVKADDGVNVWVNSYDRQLTDVFAIQEEIATAIAAALSVPLGLKPGENLVNNRTIEPEFYQQFLRAIALVRARGLERLTDAAALLEQVVARNPEFAPAWAWLAQAYDLTPQYGPVRNSGSLEEFRRVVEEFLPKAEAAYRRALQLDPNLSHAYSGLATLQYQRGKTLESEELYSKALALDPNDPDALHSRSERLAAVGRLKEALAMRLQLRALEPFVPVFNQATAQVLWLNGQNDDAIALGKTLTPSQPTLAMIYASMGRYGDAADILERIPSGIYPPGMTEAAARLLRTAPSTTTSPRRLPRLGTLVWVYLYVGAADRVIEEYEFVVEGRRLDGLFIDAIWHPSYAPMRKTERFKKFMRNAGFVEYWRARGWPDLCRPVGADDFACT